MLKGGYAMINCRGLELTETDPQSIDGVWEIAKKAVESGKLIIAYNSVYNDAPVSPVPCFGWYIDTDEIVIVGATLHIHVKDDNTATVLDVVS